MSWKHFIKSSTPRCLHIRPKEEAPASLQKGRVSYKDRNPRLASPLLPQCRRGAERGPHGSELGVKGVSLENKVRTQPHSRLCLNAIGKLSESWTHKSRAFSLQLIQNEETREEMLIKIKRPVLII